MDPSRAHVRLRPTRSIDCIAAGNAPPFAEALEELDKLPPNFTSGEFLILEFKPRCFATIEMAAQPSRDALAVARADHGLAQAYPQRTPRLRLSQLFR